MSILRGVKGRQPPGGSSTHPLTSYWGGTSLAVASILAITMFGSLASCKSRRGKRSLSSTPVHEKTQQWHKAGPSVGRASLFSASSKIKAFYFEICCWDFLVGAVFSLVKNLSMNLSFPGSGSHLLSQLLVFGLQGLAVAAPGSVELDQNVFGGIVDDGVKVLGDHHLQTGEADGDPAAGLSRAGGRLASSP